MTRQSGDSTGAGGEAEGEVLIGIENINGSFFADVLTGNDVANVLIAIGGDDEPDGGAGNDELFGGDGFDAAAYVFATAGVTVDLGNRETTPGTRRAIPSVRLRG